MNVLLDTHAFLWWATDPAKLSPAATAACRDADNDLLLSAATIWELVIKQSLSKLQLDPDVRTIVTRELDANRVTLLHVHPAHLWVLDSLPHHHRDPFDRMLIAQAKAEDATLITVDPQVARYDVKCLW